MNRVELQQNGPGVSNNGLDDTQAHRNVGASAEKAPGPAFSTGGNQPTGVTQDQAGKPRGKRRVIAVCAGTAVLIAGLVLGFIPRWLQGRTAVADMNQLAIPTVSLVSPTPQTSGNGLTLPAEIR